MRTYKMRRTLVEQALDKASEYEKQGNIKQAEKFLALAERAEKVYNKLESPGDLR